jgi:hypothetical protein
MIGMPFSFNALWFRVPPCELLEQRAVAGSVGQALLPVLREYATRQADRQECLSY